MKKFYRNEHDGWLLGVCQGLGEHFNIDPFFFRVAFLLLPHMMFFYIIFGLFAPVKEDPPCDQ